MQLGKNIYELRKEKGLSQEKLAEQINVTRQTISNWELGETYPNPEQLLLLSKALEKSVDELLENEMNSPVNKENVGEASIARDDTESAELIKKIRVGLAIIFGAILGVWAYSANRFRYDEILMFTGVGAVVGYCLGMVCHSILKYLKKK
ncbi:MAG: helix-turn-helix transcriptional regulator [Agathobacter sp.]|nr:helix-turn-helix transcriptional regulator [Agathobacter sp.]